MPVLVPAAARPRQELDMAIVEGQNRVQNLIGPRILPPMPLTRRTAHIIKATLADTLALRTIAESKYIHAPGTRFERAVAKFADDTLSLTIRGLEIVVPNETKLDMAGFVAVEQFFVARFGETQVLTRELLISLAIFNTTIFGAATNSGVAYTAANMTYAAFVAGTGMNPIGDIIAATRRVKAKGEVADTVVMSGPVHERVKQAFGTLQYVKGIWSAQRDATDDELLAALRPYGIKQVLVGDSYRNTAADGATPSLSQVWSNTYIWVGRAGNVGEASSESGVGVPTLAGVGATPFWQGYTVGGDATLDTEGDGVMKFDGGNYVETYPAQDLNSVIVRVKMSDNPYIGNPRAGDLIATQYS